MSMSWLLFEFPQHCFSLVFQLDSDEDFSIDTKTGQLLQEGEIKYGNIPFSFPFPIHFNYLL